MFTLLREWLATSGDLAILVLAIIVWRIKMNDLPHIYERMGKIEKSVAYNKGKADGQV